VDIDIDIDHRSPEASEARRIALQLLAARVGGAETYESEFSLLVTGLLRSAQTDIELATAFAYAVDAQCTIAWGLLALLSELEPDELAPFARADPQDLMKAIDAAIEKQLSN
jgi:hypothetical protein